MVLYLYKFAKKSNSTATTFDKDAVIDRSIGVVGVLLNNSSVLNPIVEISQKFSDEATINPNTPITEFNYAKIEDFNRYYFIENWTYSGNGFWSASMRVDVLASYKEQIGLSMQYVLRSASRGDNTVADSIYAVKTDYDLEIDYPATEGRNSQEAYHAWKNTANPEFYYRYCLGILNADGGEFGAVSYYMLSSSQLKSLLEYLMGSTDWLDVGEIGAGLLKSLFNPLQYIVSCKMFPADFEAFPSLDGAVMEQIKFGWWETPVYGRKLTTTTKVNIPQFTFNIHSHPGVFGVDGVKYVDDKPYTIRTCYIEPFGKFELPSFTGSPTKVDCWLDVDFISGRGLLKMKTDVHEDYIVYREGIVGTDVQLSQMNTDMLGVAAGILQTVGGVATSAASGDIGGAIGSLTSGIVSTVGATIPTIETHGVNSGYLAFMQSPRVETKHYRIVENDVERFGKPLCKIVQIKQLSGFIMCNTPTIEIESALAPEIEEIKNLMHNGFYYE